MTFSFETHSVGDKMSFLRASIKKENENQKKERNGITKETSQNLNRSKYKLFCKKRLYKELDAEYGSEKRELLRN